MAATKRNARFYVYQLNFGTGECAYIGKGSGNRLAVQKRSKALEGFEIARFWSEAESYAFERQAIADRNPALNRHPGGNGCRASRPKRDSKLFREIEKVGTRKYAARLLLKWLHLVDPSKVDLIRAVAQ